jgi:hypothetical protein
MRADVQARVAYDGRRVGLSSGHEIALDLGRPVLRDVAPPDVANGAQREAPGLVEREGAEVADVRAHASTRAPMHLSAHAFAAFAVGNLRVLMLGSGEVAIQ